MNIARSNDGGKTWSQPIVRHRDKTQTEHGFVSLIPLSDGPLGAVWLDSTLSSYGHIIVPFVLIGLGIYIIIESGTLKLFGVFK